MKLHEQHKGHESMHAEMVLILLVTLIVAQIVLVEWKKRHYKSYQVIFITIILYKCNLDGRAKVHGDRAFNETFGLLWTCEICCFISIFIYVGSREQ